METVESASPAPAESSPPSPSVQIVSAAELVAEESTPPAAPPPGAPAAPAELAPAAAPRKFRKFEDYAALDWNKSNAELAAEMGVSRDRIKQVRREMRGNINPRAAAAEALPRNSDGSIKTPDFSNLPPTQQPPEVPSLGGPGVAPGTVPPINPAAPAPASDAEIRLAAEMTFDSVVGGLAMGIGEEWLPRKLKLPSGQEIDEREGMIKAIERYYKAKGIVDLPPGVVLAMACSAYAMARLQVPNTRQKIGFLFGKVKSFFSGLIGRFFRRAPKIQVMPKGGEEQ